MRAILGQGWDGTGQGWEQREKAKVGEGRKFTVRRQPWTLALALQTTTQNSNTKGLMLGQVKLIGIWSSYNQKGQDTGQWWCTG